MRTRYLTTLPSAILFLTLASPSAKGQTCQGGSVSNFCLPAISSNEVVGVSEIQTPYSSTVTSYSATELGYNVALYYDAYVEANLYQGAGSWVAGGYASGNPTAGGTLSVPATLYTSYQVQSEHYLIAYYLVYDPDTGQYEYENPYYFLSGGGSGGGGFYGGGGSYYLTSEYLDLGSTYWVVYTTPPQISAIDNAGTVTPGSATLNSSGSFDIHGTALTANGDDMTPLVSVSGSGVTLQLSSVSDTLITVSYTVSSTSTSTGQHGISITTYAGTSNVVNINVGDPTPAITSISPNNWYAGTTTQFTINGSGFGTNPALTVTGNGIASSAITGIPNDTQITATVNVSSGAPAGTATVSVQSNGYGGSGFLPAQQGQSNQGQANAQVIPQGPVPQIMFLGNNIANQIVSVVVGQQIALTASVPGVTVSSNSWSTPTGTAVGGPPSVAGGSMQGLPSTTTAGFTFYWVDLGNSRQITYTYTSSSGTNSATATFNVDGPSGVSVSEYLAPANARLTGGTPYLELGDGNPNGVKSAYGIWLTASETHLPASGSGEYVWVQLISNYTLRERKNDGSAPQKCVPNGLFTNPNTAELDAVYPYSTGRNFNDSPNAPLAGYTEVEENFAATTYLMWDPALPSGCTPASVTSGGSVTPSNCASIPVPVGQVPWGWSGDTTDTMNSSQGSNGTTWTALACTVPSSASFSSQVLQSSNAFPTWQGTIPTNTPQSQFMTCQNQ